MDTQKIIEHWLSTSNDDFETMNDLFAAKKFNWALFLGHISTEKLLKALYVKKHAQHAPFTHNLFRLAELSGIEITDEYADWLFQITTFNLNARYDDYKKEFYEMCTPEFTQLWMQRINIIRTWIISKLQTL